MRVEGGSSFYIGETVAVRVRVSEPGTRTPVVLDAIELIQWQLRGGEVGTLPDWDFTEVAPGSYRMSIQTVDLDPGVYDFGVRLTRDADVTIERDYIVLKEMALTPEP